MARDMKTLEEWIDLYDKKAPEPFKRDERFEFFFLPDKGFCEIGQTQNLMIINQLCGDARFWKKKTEEAARATGLKMAGTWCIRSAILAYIRLFNYRIERTEELPDGLKRYHTREKTTGKYALVSPVWEYADGQRAYMITWEV